MDVVDRARAVDVRNMLVVGVDIETSRRCIEIAQEFSLCAGAAYHPSSVRGWSDEWIEDIDELHVDPHVRAVGETGLDFYWDTSYVEDQKAAFAAHIALAKKHDKALVIHTRDSIDAALETLENDGAPERLIFHCWTGDDAALRRALRLGAYISFAGNVSYSKNDDLRAAARAVPEDRLLVETDSPYLSPKPVRHMKNEPAFVVHVGAAVAAARGVAAEEVAVSTAANAQTVFGL